jgi:hypothetical protein
MRDAPVSEKFSRSKTLGATSILQTLADERTALNAHPAADRCIWLEAFDAQHVRAM